MHLSSVLLDLSKFLLCNGLLLRLRLSSVLRELSDFLGRDFRQFFGCIELGTEVPVFRAESIYGVVQHFKLFSVAFLGLIVHVLQALDHFVFIL